MRLAAPVIMPIGDRQGRGGQPWLVAIRASDFVLIQRNDLHPDAFTKSGPNNGPPQREWSRPKQE